MYCGWLGLVLWVKNMIVWDVIAIDGVRGVFWIDEKECSEQEINAMREYVESHYLVFREREVSKHRKFSYEGV